MNDNVGMNNNLNNETPTTKVIKGRISNNDENNNEDNNEVTNINKKSVLKKFIKNHSARRPRKQSRKSKNI